MKLYAHPFSSYCQKALIALYENDIPFDYRSLEEPAATAELEALWPRRCTPIAPACCSGLPSPGL